MNTERQIVDFISRLQHDVEVLIGAVSADRSRAVLAALANNTFETVPRPAAKKTIANRASLARGPARAKRNGHPIQMCPAPRCKNRAAPVFGMLCAKHKGTQRREVAKWRAARRARKG